MITDVSMNNKLITTKEWTYKGRKKTRYIANRFELNLQPQRPVRTMKEGIWKPGISLYYIKIKTL